MSNQMLLVIEFACIFYRANLLKIVDIVFEVDKYHSWSNTLTHRVRANTLFSGWIQPSTHSRVEALKNEA